MRLRALGAWEDGCVRVGAVFGGWYGDQLWEGPRYPVKLLRLQTDLVSALVIMGHLRNLKSVISRLCERAPFTQVPVFLLSNCFQPPCEPVGTH